MFMTSSRGTNGSLTPYLRLTALLFGCRIWDAWGQGVSKCLNDGGRFVLIEFHPALTMFDEEWNIHYDYMGGSFVKFDSGIGDYVALTGAAAETDVLEPGIQDFVNPYPGIEYQWGIADVVMGLISAGLALNDLREYRFSNGLQTHRQYA